MATTAIGLITPDAGAVDDTGFLKEGSASPGGRQAILKVPWAMGKVGNLEIGVGVHAVAETAWCPLNRLLFLPASWDETTAEDERALVRQYRSTTQIPVEIGHRPK